MNVTVVIATYGDPWWQQIAERAEASVSDVPVVMVDGTDLADARNHGLSLVRTEFVCFLDADDELESGYFDAMAASEADVRAPSVRYVKRGPGVARMPQVANHVHACTADCLAEGNWLVVGAVARTQLLRGVGGWRDWPMYEDWDLWARCWKAGATIEAVPAAVYRAHVRPDSRNRAPAPQEKHATHKAIAADLGLPVPA